jgi:hypothetical protein
MCPQDGGRHPPVLLLGGGEGGYQRRHPAHVARHGFAVLSLAYFGYPRQRPLVEVPLERFEHALQWLLARPEVAGRRAVVKQAWGNLKSQEIGQLVLRYDR